MLKSMEFFRTIYKKSVPTVLFTRQLFKTNICVHTSIYGKHSFIETVNESITPYHNFISYLLPCVHVRSKY